MLQDPSSAVRTKVAEEIRWDGLLETARLKHALAKDSCPETRRFTASGLYLHSDPESRSILDGLTRDQDGKVRAEAIGSLRAIEKNPPEVKDYISLVSDPDSEVRAQMASWLGDAEEAFSLPHLLHLVHDSDALVRGRSIHSLNGLKDPRATESIVRATSDADGWIRAMALEILGYHDVPGVMELLLAHVDDPVSDVRKVVAQRLESRVTPELLPVLEKLSEDEQNVNTRRSALRSLDKIPGEEAELLITRMLRDPSQIIVKAAKKALVARAKKEAIAPGTVFELQYGRELSVATRLAFHGRSSVPLKAWEKFLSEVQRWDGRGAASSENMPCVRFETKQGRHHCILPFGPAHWIRIDFLPNATGFPEMGYGILTTPQIAAWSKEMKVRHFQHGQRLARRLGWFEDSEAAPDGSSPMSDLELANGKQARRDARH